MADDAATDDWEPVERRRRSTSAGSFDDLSEPEPELSRAARRNMERRRRRRAEKAAEEPAADAARAPTEADAERALRKVEKALSGIAADARRGRRRLTDEERAKLSRRDAAEAARAAWSALLLGFELKRQRADAIYAALENVRFEDAFECACCREVLELPVALPCRHEFCRACVAGVAKRAKRASDVKCPACRAPFYDGAAKSGRGGGGDAGPAQEARGDLPLRREGAPAAASSSVRAIVADEKREAAKKKATWAGVAK
ncbi:hypothetical protein JL720_1103 [Aureococcus anophagefferens]|nr:hypothetical protein JL720_1103 [Aureococcus anophagefferens]